MNRRLFLTLITASLAYYLIPEPALAEGEVKGESKDESKSGFQGRWRMKSVTVVLRQRGGKVRGWVTSRSQRKRFRVEGKTNGGDTMVVTNLGVVKLVGGNLVFADDNGTQHTFTPY